MTEKIEKQEMKLKQEEFYELFVNGDREMFGNGVQCYLEVYEIDKTKPNWYKTACAASSRLLSNVKVINRIRELLEAGGFNDENIEKQHLFLVNQFTDLGTKMRAISDFYKFKGKYAPEESHIVLETPEPIYAGKSKKVSIP
mgnify:CR=1 FL=1